MYIIKVILIKIPATISNDNDRYKINFSLIITSFAKCIRNYLFNYPIFQIFNVPQYFHIRATYVGGEYYFFQISPSSYWNFYVDSSRW